MKKIITMILTFAIAVSGVFPDTLTPGKEVKAADNYYGCTTYDNLKNGYDENGYDENGYDRDGYDENGYDIDGYDIDGYDIDGYDIEGYGRDGYNRDGYDRDGYNRGGYDRDGYDRDGYNIFGYNRDGYNRDGYDRDGYDRDGYDRDGYNRDGYNRDGYDRDGYNRDGYNRGGYDKDGYDRDGYDRGGYNREGYNRDGYGRSGYNKEGYDKEGYNREGYNKDGYGKDGYNKEGYDKDGYSREGYNREGYFRDGYNREGYNKDGYDKDGYNREGYNREGYDRNGYDKNGYNKDGYDRKGYDKYKCKKGEKPIAINKKNFGDIAKSFIAEYDDNDDGYLSQMECEGVERVNITDFKKKSDFPNVKGLNYFPNVTHLDLYCNNSKLNLSNLKSLRYVNIGTSTKKEFTLNAPYAKYIEVSGVGKYDYEKVSEGFTIRSTSSSEIKINLSSCKRAEVINTRNNCVLPKKAKNLKSISVSKMKHYKNFNASGYPDLRELEIFSSTLESINLTKCQKLTYLYFYYCKNISSIDARRCKIKAVDACSCDKLKSDSKIKVKAGAKKSIDKGRWWINTSAYKKRSWDRSNYYSS